jgi:hypothetical protein
MMVRSLETAENGEERKEGYFGKWLPFVTMFLAAA